MLLAFFERCLFVDYNSSRATRSGGCFFLRILNDYRSELSTILFLSCLDIYRISVSVIIIIVIIVSTNFNFISRLSSCSLISDK